MEKKGKSVEYDNEIIAMLKNCREYVNELHKRELCHGISFIMVIMGAFRKHFTMNIKILSIKKF